ncbi:MAG: hypothetical protein KatS3mg068_1349 [Candidatus Sericytochromatia bacterium]|nr:MAG: hypothetical protein KatS3mg068_1349 [Candidatus Sericytochromatia bacterium]
MQITRFDIEKWYLKYEFTSKYNLSSSGISPSFFTKKNKELLKLIYDFPYSQAKGRKELIKILASIYNVKEENIIVTNGAIESLFILQILFSTKKEKIICLKPCYNGLFNIFKSFGTKIIDWEIRYEDNFRPNFEYLEYLIKKHKPKYIIVINFPNNPTGIDLTERRIFCIKGHIH